MSGASTTGGLPPSAQREEGQYDDPTPTQKIWGAVSELDIAHHQAFQALQSAMNHGDLDGAAKAHIRIGEIEVEQARAHAAARNYILAKVQA